MFVVLPGLSTSNGVQGRIVLQCFKRLQETLREAFFLPLPGICAHACNEELLYWPASRAQYVHMHLYVQVGGYDTLSQLYDDPDALEELLLTDRQRMMARSTIEVCIVELHCLPQRVYLAKRPYASQYRIGVRDSPVLASVTHTLGSLPCMRLPISHRFRSYL
jgi:hypothetical protein